MAKRRAILDRMKRLTEALEKAHEYLASGAHGHWTGFRPLFGGSRNRLPHRDWIANVFIPGRLRALRRCEIALETVRGRAKERRINERRRGS
jgi:hypothetical protein